MTTLLAERTEQLALDDAPSAAAPAVTPAAGSPFATPRGVAARPYWNDTTVTPRMRAGDRAALVSVVLALVISLGVFGTVAYEGSQAQAHVQGTSSSATR